MRTTFKTLCLLLTNILLLLSSCVLGALISSIPNSKSIYKNANIQITYMLLLANAGLSLFTFVIVQNLNDVFLHRARSPRGVETKMKIQWIILSIVTFFFGVFHLPLITSNTEKFLKMDIMALMTATILALQVSEKVNFRLLCSSLYTPCIQTCLESSITERFGTMWKDLKQSLVGKTGCDSRLLQTISFKNKLRFTPIYRNF
ncbi:hypothetical protein P7C65_11s1g18890 [Encephalitozoon intestinalis]|nr:hypothetical protein GPK93_11g20600 [Encephalitozoon intestinalis]